MVSFCRLAKVISYILGGAVPLWGTRQIQGSWDFSWCSWWWQSEQSALHIQL